MMTQGFQRSRRIVSAYQIFPPLSPGETGSSSSLQGVETSTTAMQTSSGDRVASRSADGEKLTALPPSGLPSQGGKRHLPSPGIRYRYGGRVEGEEPKREVKKGPSPESSHTSAATTLPSTTTAKSQRPAGGEEGYGIDMLLYDGTFGGFLTAVFECYAERKDCRRVEIVPYDRFESSILRNSSFPLGGERLLTIPFPLDGGEKEIIHHDHEKAERVWRGLRRYLTREELDDIYATFLGESSGREGVMLKGISRIFRTKQKPEQSEESRLMRWWGSQVRHERDRHIEFLRFHETANGQLYALVSPEYNILPLILPHFREAFMEKEWVIYDIRRQYGFHATPDGVREVLLQMGPWEDPEKFFGRSPAEREELVQQLWDDYFQTSQAPGLKSSPPYARNLPKRYWRYLEEGVGENI